MKSHDLDPSEAEFVADKQPAGGRTNHTIPDTGIHAVWQMLLRRARRRGFAFWYIGLVTLCGVALGYLGTQPFTALVFFMVMNCGWGGTALTMWEEIRSRGAQTDFLMLPISSRDWRWALDRFFFLGFAITLSQFLIYVVALAALEPMVLDNFLRWNRPPSIRALRLLFHALVVWVIIGFFWSGYWACVWRGWPLALVAVAPFVIAAVAYLSVARLVDMRVALGGMGTVLMALGFLIRNRVGRLWTIRAGTILLPK